jgi:hypothetical protein
MRYLCLVYFEPSRLASFTKSEGAALTNESIAYNEELQRSGRYVQAHALQSVEEAMTVRVRNGAMSATDGPFAETREVLGGFILIEAPDLNAAVTIAAGIPLARFGSVEVRPIQEMEKT